MSKRITLSELKAILRDAEPVTFCQICGCAEFAACVDEQTLARCAWFVPGLCTFCVIGVRAPDPFEREPLYVGLALWGLAP